MDALHILLRSGNLVLLGLSLSRPGSGGQEPIRLRIERSSVADHVAQVEFSIASGKPYRVSQSLDLNYWRIRETGVAPAAGVVRFAVPSEKLPGLFLRVEVIPIQPLEQMVWIEPGEFRMGSPPDEEGRFLDKEEPQTRVTLTRGYWMSKYEVTQAEFEAVMGSNPSSIKGDPQRPVENVAWFDAVRYCAELTGRERQAARLPEGFEYRLPTEAEWAHAARAGTTTRFSHGDDPGYERLSDYAWYAGNSGLRPHPVGRKQPNPWGLHDMHGNIAEWCLDWFGRLPGGWVTDPQGPSEGVDRIVRGGYWDSTPAMCRSAVRVHAPPATRFSYLGFRVVLAGTAGS